MNDQSCIKKLHLNNLEIIILIKCVIMQLILVIYKKKLISIGLRKDLVSWMNNNEKLNFVFLALN